MINPADKIRLRTASSNNSQLFERSIITISVLNVANLEYSQHFEILIKKKVCLRLGNFLFELDQHKYEYHIFITVSDRHFVTHFMLHFI